MTISTAAGAPARELRDPVPDPAIEAVDLVKRYRDVTAVGRSVLLGGSAWPDLGLAVAVLAGLAGLTYPLAVRRCAALTSAS